MFRVKLDDYDIGKKSRITVIKVVRVRILLGKHITQSKEDKKRKEQVVHFFETLLIFSKV